MNFGDSVKKAMEEEAKNVEAKNVEAMSNLILQMDYSKIAPAVLMANEIGEESMSDVLAFTRREVKKQNIILLVYLNPLYNLDEGLIFTGQGLFYWEEEGKRRENIPYEQIEQVDFTDDSVILSYQGVSLTIYLGENAAQEKFPRYMYNFIMEILENMQSMKIHLPQIF